MVVESPGYPGPGLFLGSWGFPKEPPRFTLCRSAGPLPLALFTLLKFKGKESGLPLQYELPLFLNHFEGAEESPATPQASAAELLSSIVGKPQAENLLSRYHTLTDLAKASVYELHEVPGVGKSKAAAIKAAFLLAQKLSEEQTPESALLDTPDRVADLLREQNRLYDVELFQVVLVNTRRRLIEVQNISQGTLDTLLVHPREVFARSVTRKAAAMILVHNHPSGDPAPSEADIKVTRDLIRGGQVLKIEVLDHIILGKRSEERPRDFVSLRELGYFWT